MLSNCPLDFVISPPYAGYMRLRRCPTCHTTFQPKSGNHKYCRPQCNPRISKIEKYRKKLIDREGPRYVALGKLLSDSGIQHTFEYVLGDFIYDLCLPKQKILVEFQGTGHLQPNLQIRDYKKAWEPQIKGWSVLWIPVNRGGEIPTEWLRKLIQLCR